MWPACFKRAVLLAASCTDDESDDDSYSSYTKPSKGKGGKKKSYGKGYSNKNKDYDRDSKDYDSQDYDRYGEGVGTQVETRRLAEVWARCGAGGKCAGH